MKFILDYQASGFDVTTCKKSLEKLLPEINRCRERIAHGGYADGYAFLSLPNDSNYYDQIMEIVVKKKSLNPALLIIIGIGGSNLGILALQEALYGKLYNDMNPTTKIYYADTVDADYCATLMLLAEQTLQQKKTVLINVITKSGTTTETIANYALFLELLIKWHPDNYQDYVVVTTDRNSVLWIQAQQDQMCLLEIPQHVGGRFSVFSAVGLFALGILGCNLEQLMRGAASMLTMCTSDLLDENYAAITACIAYEQLQRGVTIQDMFLFAVQLESVGKWYRQLMGESIGKEYNLNGVKVETGITPTVSMGTADLHSVGQLYLGGPRDKCETFVSCREHKRVLNIPGVACLKKVAIAIAGKPMSMLMDAILHGVKIAYVKNKRPFISIEIPELNEYYVGQFLQYKMIEMVYLGFLLDVNPFDQPNVELYKKETREILKK